MRDFFGNVLILTVSLAANTLTAPQNFSPAPFFAKQSSQVSPLLKSHRVEAPEQAPTASPSLTCQATNMGSPCAQGGVATLGAATPLPDHGMGNPVDRRSGNKYQRETDLPGGLDSSLELVRHYNAMDPRQSALGRGWSWSYDSRLYVLGTGVQIIQADASRIAFTCSDDRCISTDFLRGTLHRDPSGWKWRWPTGERLRFDNDGRLTEVAQLSGRVVQILRHRRAGLLSGHIDQIIETDRDHSRVPLALARQRDARVLKFIYQQHSNVVQLATVQTRLGIFHYVYDNPQGVSEQTPRLIAMVRPDGMQRRYHYEPEFQSGQADALTGISIAAKKDGPAMRTHTWRYDRSGRAVMFVPGIFESGKVGLGIAFSEADLGLGVTRDAHHMLRTIRMDIPGWPALNMVFDQQGAMTDWHARGMGPERWERAAAMSTRQFADQTVWQWSHDRHGRLRSMRAEAANVPSVLTRIAWRGEYPALISHPEETQILRYGRSALNAGRVREREVIRHCARRGASWSYRDRFTYDAQGRRSFHGLPEGGGLYYQWLDHRLLSIEWVDVRGKRHVVFESTAAGLRHGNGLMTAMQMGSAGLHELLVYQPSMHWPIFRQQMTYDSLQAIASEQIQNGGEYTRHTYRRDALQRMTGYRSVREGPGFKPGAAFNVTMKHLAWRTSGESLSQYNFQNTSGQPDMFAEIRRDTSGLPAQIDDYVLQFNAQRRLSQVRKLSDPARIVRYAYNAFGERIRREEADKLIHYLFDQNKLVAEAQVTGAGVQVTRRYIYANHVPVAVIENGRELFMIHADAVGLPRLMTDANQRIRWQGAFTPFGELLSEQGDLSLALRLPGQFADPLTGWHDNYQRTYDPVRGHYLEPDPLGPVPGNSLYGYADQQPRRHADPRGLMLFAFDGTGNQPASLTNVWLFSKAYRDGPVHYIAGPAGDENMSAASSTTDAAIAWSGGARVDQQWERLLNAIATMKDISRPIPIDIVGFSRGAALARHFGNRVVEHVKQGRFWSHHPMHGVISTCVDMRFMGLFDTVAQFNVLGAGNAVFNLELSPAWKWVSHAVALHEHRWLFPLTSAAGASNVVERAFVGAHADIGGGYLTAEASPGSTPGNLSQVALAWMQWQAQAAGLGMSSQPKPESVTTPVVHDERAVFARRMQNGDRRVNHADGTKWANYQSDLPRMGQGLRREVELFIRRHPHPALLRPDAVGLVDMTGYAAWLKDSMGFVW